jgi:hypothetical protein
MTMYILLLFCYWLLVLASIGHHHASTYKNLKKAGAYSTVRSESRCALRLQYVDLVKRVQACISARGHHFRHLL